MKSDATTEKSKSMCNKVVIHQAHFLPWIPYVAMLSMSDIFVVLDDVQYKPRYFINRTKVYSFSNNRFEWVTVPNNGTQSMLTKNVKIIRDKNYIKIDNKISYEYKHCSFFYLWNRVSEIIEDNNIENLIDLNIAILKHVFNLLDMKMPTIYFSSELLADSLPQNRTERFILICERINTNIILCGIGKSCDIHDRGILDKHQIQLVPMNKDVIEELRIKNGLSILHEILCEGTNVTKSIIEQIRKRGYFI